ncbi:hypothetical protein FB567DRAFT_554337 [Paraphoma chrysanthemicola]|uniref:Uncharacterized protein n=1 Tax=Paraphoma chrysanthemicola TaxID=798071 RepID=A0A8K0QVU2_9PLEO|nr:hypothetical protein FB567DRAFT_554337 [Paraphoma chrysanthemicola]
MTTSYHPIPPTEESGDAYSTLQPPVVAAPIADLPPPATHPQSPIDPQRQEQKRNIVTIAVVTYIVLAYMAYLEFERDLLLVLVAWVALMIACGVVAGAWIDDTF